MNKAKLFLEKFSEAFISCGICMVQGDITVLSLKHILIAAQTGSLTGLAIVVASFLPWTSAFIGIWLTGLFTAISDWLIHSPHFPLESIVTGVGAMALALFYEKAKKITSKNT